MNGRPMRVTLASAAATPVTPPPVIPPPVVGVVPPRLSTVSIVQANPVDATADQVESLILVPQDGLGPFLFTMITAGNYLLRGPSGQPAASNATGVVCGHGGACVVRVSDARGDHVDVTVTTATAPAPTLFANNALLAIDNSGPMPDYAVRHGSTNPYASYSFTNQDGSVPTAWRFNADYGETHIQWIGGAMPAVGASWALRLRGLDGSGNELARLDLTPHVVQSPGIPFVELVQTSQWSTALDAGSIIGALAATTPRNNPNFAITDSTGSLHVDAVTGALAVIKRVTTPGPFSVVATITDAGATATKTITIPVVAGTILPASNMTIPNLATGLLNDSYANTIGTAVVSGMSGPARWTMTHQKYFNEDALLHGLAAPLQVDAASALVTAPLILSADVDGTSPRTYEFTLSATDGVNVCTQTFTFPVAWAPVSKTIHVGRGKSSYGSSGAVVGFETFAEARAISMGRHAGTYHVITYADADPDYYTNDNGTRTQDGSLRFPWQGPIVLEGVAANGVARPRGGGPASNLGTGGSDERGKGFITAGDGDMVVTNWEGSDCHDGYSTDGYHGVEWIRKDGETPGNLTVMGTWIHDCDNGILTGFAHGSLYVLNTLIERCGSSHNSSGLDHNIYCGELAECTVRNSTSRHAITGHAMKCRAQMILVDNCDMHDGIGGSASALIEAPNGGVIEVKNSRLRKGLMAMGPDAIRVGYEGYVYSKTSVSVHDNELIIETLPGSHYGDPHAVAMVYGANSDGTPMRMTLANNAVFLQSGTPGSAVLTFMQAVGSVQHNTDPVVSGTTVLARPTAMNLARPDVSGSLPASKPAWREYSQDDFNFFGDTYQVASVDQVMIPASTAAGAALFTAYASNPMGAQSEGATNPFGAGTVWTIDKSSTYWGYYALPWAADGLFALATSSAGVVTVTTASAVTAGQYALQLLATASNGAKSLMRYPITVTP